MTKKHIAKATQDQNNKEKIAAPSKYKRQKGQHTQTNTNTQTGLLTIVELAVALLTVDNIKTVGDFRHHVADFKVEPLGVLATVNICIQYEVIFIPIQQKQRET